VEHAVIFGVCGELMKSSKGITLNHIESSGINSGCAFITHVETSLNPSITSFQSCAWPEDKEKRVIGQRSHKKT